MHTQTASEGLRRLSRAVVTDELLEIMQVNRPLVERAMAIATHDCIPNAQGRCDACGKSLELRCSAPHPQRQGQCGKLLAEVIVAPYRLTCPRCGTVAQEQPLGVLR